MSATFWTAAIRLQNRRLLLNTTTRRYGFRSLSRHRKVTRPKARNVSAAQSNTALILPIVGVLGGLVAGGTLCYQTTLHYERVFVKEDELVVQETAVVEDEEEKMVKKYEHPMNKLPWYLQWLYKLKRIVFLTCLFMPCTAVSLAAYLTNDQSLKDYCLALLVYTIETAGCTFQKYGQWVSNRPDMFPKCLTDTLKKLCTQSPMHSEMRTREAFKQSFGVEIEDIFDEFDMIPVASGTVAQVYRAKLKPEYALEDGNVEVAVKVRHPNVMPETFYDVDILYHFINLGSYFNSMFSVPFAREEFVKLLQKQVDLTCEACNLQKFSDNFASETKAGSVVFPSFSRKLLSPSVLVEGWAQGEVLGEFFNAGKDAVVKARDTLETFSQTLGDQVIKSRQNMATTIFDTAIKMLLRDNLVHGDLHGGNVMYNVENNSMTVIDAGITCTLDGDAGTDNFVRFLYSMCTAQGDKLSESLLTMSEVPATLDRAAFDADINNALEMFMDTETRKAHVGTGHVPVGDITGEIFRTLQRHKMSLVGDVITVILSIALLEGLLEQLDPGFNMLEKAIPYMTRYRFDVVRGLLYE